MKLITALSDYGPGGLRCICCGPSPKNRKEHQRTSKHRMNTYLDIEMKEEIDEHYEMETNANPGSHQAT